MKKNVDYRLQQRIQFPPKRLDRGGHLGRVETTALEHRSGRRLVFEDYKDDNDGK